MKKVREDLDMRKSWLASLTATLCAVGIAGSSASGSPVNMAAHPYAPQTPAPVAAPTQAQAAVAGEAPRPSSLISPTKNPIKYFRAAMSELPRPSMPSMPSMFKGWGSENEEMQPVRPANDALSLSTPVGPPTPQLLISTAQLYERQGDIERARGHFQQALAIWPGNVEVFRAAARMEDRQNNLPVAENLYRQAVASNPNHAGALNDLGLCLARQGRMDQSVQVIEQAIVIQPDKPLFRNNAATVLVEMRQDQRALGHLAAVHNAADANFNLGQLLVQRGRAADAVPYFQTALQLNPQMETAQMALARLQPPAVGATAQYAPAPAAQQVAPSVAPVMGPQGAPLTGPQYGYPTTARAPEMNSADVVPRYLPPVATQPGVMPR
jgi:tetratricopeptide (TPR) repeat protein